MIDFNPEWEGLTNAQLAAKLGVSRTYVMYQRRRAAGLCERCGDKLGPGSSIYCEKHRKAINAMSRKRNGHKPWHPGGVGRPPKGAKRNA